MKNIHIIQTDKSSRLFIYDGKLSLSKEFQYGSDAIQNQNIYITNDEEIKEGDWYLVWLRDKWEVLNYMPSTGYRKEVCKIILTTDQDLIKDGVQSIDDEFLEWFVKNPSCEEVEVEEHLIDTWENTLTKYKIIIPKEEPKQKNNFGLPQFGTKEFNDLASQCFGGKPKQDALNHFSSTSSVIVKDPQISNFNKQETLEEAASLAKEEYPVWLDEEVFILGAKWMQERMYSEEEVLEILNELGWGVYVCYSGNIPISEWMLNAFEKYKKK